MHKRDTSTTTNAQDASIVQQHNHTNQANTSKRQKHALALGGEPDYPSLDNFLLFRPQVTVYVFLSFITSSMVATTLM